MADVGKNINQAMQLLRAGELVAIPTETVYGLAANALNKEAVVKIFEAKNRPSFDPLIVHVNRVSAFSAYAREVPDAALQLAEVVCPGPVTFIFKKKQIIPDLVTSGHQTVGLRVPNHPLALDLLNRLEFPLAAPSANPFGYTSPTNARHVQEQMGEKIPYILDGGECAVGLESTIIDFSQKKPRVLRLGGLALELIEEMLGEHVAVQTSSSNPQAPGMLSSHYNPGKPVLVGNIHERMEQLANQRIGGFGNERIGVLAFNAYVSGIPQEHQRILSPTGNLAEAARNFFGMLRSFNAIDVDVVLAEWLPDEGLGRAMNDRLKRAAARQN
jgi:L-threonylcarbamoyladenylate synthase